MLGLQLCSMNTIFLNGHTAHVRNQFFFSPPSCSSHHVSAKSWLYPPSQTLKHPVLICSMAGQAPHWLWWWCYSSAWPDPFVCPGSSPTGVMSSNWVFSSSFLASSTGNSIIHPVTNLLTPGSIKFKVSSRSEGCPRQKLPLRFWGTLLYASDRRLLFT